ncbi:Cys/Met metabolism PLP-dependent enzyme-domain-containing protein [Chytridium lagenaria]|nr:Cys/Met metabolism PLP-dependent enzyme-domain-containing protein [Chytridium lagenaria]
MPAWGWVKLIDKGTTSDVAPPIHVSTTYNYAKNWNEVAAIKNGHLPADELTANISADPVAKDHIYSRHAVTYASGLAAVIAAFQFYQPRRVIISNEGYHGTHGSLNLYKRGRDYLDGIPELKAGDLVWLESPAEPTWRDLRLIKSKAPPGAIVAVDATFAPPPLQFCLAYGADVVMHSSTKFLGGHSDLLGGAAKQLRVDRTFAGSVMGNLESWLLLRSLRTLEVRVRKQSETATKLAEWLSKGDRSSDPTLLTVLRVWHGSIETTPGHAFLKRVGAGYSGVLSIEFSTVDYARLVVSHLKLFKNATSLGGVESLIEWRAAIDPKIDPKICRDLKNDFRNAFVTIQKLAPAK